MTPSSSHVPSPRMQSGPPSSGEPDPALGLVPETWTPPPGFLVPGDDSVTDGGGDAPASLREDALAAAALKIDREVLSMGLRSNDRLVDRIVAFGIRARELTAGAVRFETLSRLNKWAMGRLLGVIKANVGHGGFERWLQQHRGKLGFGKSTAENYLKLARDFPTATAFLREVTPLRDLYAGRGAEGECDPPAREREEEAGERTVRVPPRPAEALMRSLAGVQKRFRRLTASEDQLTDDELVRLRLLKTEIDQCYDRIVAHKA